LWPVVKISENNFVYSISMARRYELKRRAEKREETRQRIVEATVGLHESVGPARTTVSAVAQRAGVQRLTVYRHFPDERALLAACSGHWVAMNPAPDPAPWRGIRDPEERLAEALGEIYAFYGRTEPMMANLVRDAPKMPVLAELLAPYQHYLVAVRDILAAGWGARGRRRELLLAALGHALDFATWRSLVRGQGLDDGRAGELMVRMVRSAARE
jgi:AcrR family transcriptional regulator